MELIDKIVRFDSYCHICKHKDVKETDDPCNECLTEPVNEYSHKPVRFQDADN